MKLFQVVCGSGVALALLAGCENKTTTTGSTPPAGNSGQATTKKLTLKAPATQSIKRGDTDQLSISITRDNFNDPVTVRLNDLPKGVVCEETEATIPAGQTSTKLTLKASADAEVGEHDVKVDARAPGIQENVQTVKLNVKDKG